MNKNCLSYQEVDLCKTSDGLWLVTDMAVAEHSFHWEGCPHKGVNS